MGRKILSISIDNETLNKLNNLCKQTERQRSWLIKKAIVNLFEELEDYEIALKRLSDPADKIISHTEMRKRLAL